MTSCHSDTIRPMGGVLAVLIAMGALVDAVHKVPSVMGRLTCFSSHRSSSSGVKACCGARQTLIVAATGCNLRTPGENDACVSLHLKHRWPRIGHLPNESSFLQLAAAQQQGTPKPMRSPQLVLQQHTPKLGVKTDSQRCSARLLHVPFNSFLNGPLPKGPSNPSDVQTGGQYAIVICSLPQ